MHGQKYYPSEAAAKIEGGLLTAKNEAEWQRCQQEIDEQVGQSDEEIETIYSQCSDWMGVAKWRAGVEARRAPSQAYFLKRIIITRIR